MLFDRGNNMQKSFLQQAGNVTEWRLHSDSIGSKTVSSHQYVETLFAFIRTLERNREEASDASRHCEIQNVGLKKYGHHPSYVASMHPSNI